jgi:hypothetical protein
MEGTFDEIYARLVECEWAAICVDNERTPDEWLLTDSPELQRGRGWRIADVNSERGKRIIRRLVDSGETFEGWFGFEDDDNE